PSAVSSAHVAELRRDDNVVAMSVDCPTDELFVRERTVGVRGVEEGDAERERALDRRQRFGIITPEVEVGHAHTAQAEGGDSEALSAKGTCLHEVAWQVREPNDGAYSQRPTTTAGNAEQAASDHDVDPNKRQHSQPHGYP